MEKYKGLKEELTDIVDKINIGDGVIIKHKHEYVNKKTIGYVYLKEKRKLQVRPMKNPTSFFEKWDNEMSNYVNIPYYKIDSVKIVDLEV